jgi:hypothetical protein
MAIRSRRGIFAKQAKPFHADLDLFTKPVLKSLRSISQSHANPRDLANNIALAIPKESWTSRPPGLHQKMIGLISQLFNKIDPFTMLINLELLPFSGQQKYTAKKGSEFIRKEYSRGPYIYSQPTGIC